MWVGVVVGLVRGDRRLLRVRRLRRRSLRWGRGRGRGIRGRRFWLLGGRVGLWIEGIDYGLLSDMKGRGRSVCVMDETAGMMID
jgi:hypothetical protein